MVHCTYLGVSGYNSQYIVLFCQKIFITLTNSVDPDEIMLHFIWVFTVSKSTGLGVSRKQRGIPLYLIQAQVVSYQFESL